jgi:exopolysaccharide biosynthesis polyprenyl glycosylphosphotransferase
MDRVPEASLDATALEREQKLGPARGHAAPGERVVPRTRISRRRALWLALPGLLLIDALLVTGGFLIAVEFSHAGVEDLGLAAGAITPPLLALYVVLVSGFLLLCGMFGLYTRRALRHPRRALAGAARAVLWSGLIAVAFDFLLALDPPGDLRGLLLMHAVVMAAAVLTLRPLACRLLLRLAEVGTMPPRRVLILGQSHEARRLAASLEEDDPAGRVVVGLADGDPPQRGANHRWPRFHLLEARDALRLAHGLAADEVVLATRSLERGDAVELAAELDDSGCRVLVVPHLTNLYVDSAPVRREAGIPLLELGKVDDRVLGSKIKRVMDVILAGLGLLVVSPLMLLIAALVKVSSPGPVLHTQERVGKGGSRFRMYKFRSMSVSNDDSRHRDYVASLMFQGDAAGFDAQGRPVYKLLDDPRITLLGRLLRRTSLDELPQILNVLRGDMSLVGPRPCLPFEYDLYLPWHRHRLDSVPGMTGLWQVSGRSFLSFEEMVLLDLYYAGNWSILLDLKLLWRTVPEVVGARGAR